MDDWLGGGHTEEEVLQLARNVEEIPRSAGFTMHKWVSNSEHVLAGLLQTQPEKEVSLSDSVILGITWNTVDDCLSFRFRRTKFRDDLLDGTIAPT